MDDRGDDRWIVSLPRLTLRIDRGILFTGSDSIGIQNMAEYGDPRSFGMDPWIALVAPGYFRLVE
jgi:hypothetical protein